MYCLQQRNKEANDYIDSISDQMSLAVEQCIEAAGHEYEPVKQKDLLRVMYIFWLFYWCITNVYVDMFIDDTVVVTTKLLLKNMYWNFFTDFKVYHVTTAYKV